MGKIQTVKTCHWARNGLGWSSCEQKPSNSSKDIDEVTCPSCLKMKVKGLTYSLDKLEKRHKSMNDAFHSLANEALWAVGLLKLLIRETGALHKDCPDKGKCLVLDVNFCWVRNYEALIENKKKKTK